MGAPTTINYWSNFFNTVVGIFLKADVAGVEAYLAVQAPFLEAPWDAFITNDILQYISNAILVNTAQFGDGLIIDLQVGTEESAVKTAYAVLQKARTSGDQNAINEATRVWISAAAALAHSDGSATNTTTG